MNLEAIVLAIAGTLANILIGFLIYELRQIRHELTVRVSKVDCDKDMEGHCRRLDKVEEAVQKNTLEIVAINARM